MEPTVKPIAQVHKERLKLKPGPLLVTACSIVSGLWGPVATFFTVNQWKHDTWGFADLVLVWFMNVVLWSATMLLEYFVFDSLRRNYQSARANGYSKKRFLFHFFSILLGLETLPIALVTWCCADAVPRFDISLVLKVVGFVIAIDFVWFHGAHQALHRKFPNLHFLHHCAFVPAFSANMFFTFGDVLAEFGGPVLGSLGLFGTNLVGLCDPFAFFVVLAGMQLLYIMEHDRLLQLHHFKHHSLLNCNYFAYKPGLAPHDEHEKLHKMLQRRPCDQLLSSESKAPLNSSFSNTVPLNSSFSKSVAPR